MDERRRGSDRQGLHREDREQIFGLQRIRTFRFKDGREVQSGEYIRAELPKLEAPP